MTTGIACPVPILQFFDNFGNPMSGGSVLTTVGGVPTATYQDVGLTTTLPNPIILNSRGEVATAAGASAQCFLTPNVAYTFTLSDANGLQVNQATYVGLTGEELAASLNSVTDVPIINSFDRTSAENAAGVTPTNYSVEPFDPRRYATIADYDAVIGAVGSLPDTYPGWYRGDRGLHPTLTNCLIGYTVFDDSQKTGTVCYRNTAIGALAMQQNAQTTVAGGSNTAVGYATLQNNIEGSGNTAVGGFALNALTGTPGTPLGTDDCHHNNAFGYRVFNLATSGVQNNGFGFQVGNSLLDGDNNHGFGESVLFSLVNGNGNHAFGYQASYSKPYGDFSHAFGYQALFSETALALSGITAANPAVITLSTVSTINPLSNQCAIQFTNVSGMTEINGLIGNVQSVSGSSGAWTATLDIDASGFSAYSSGGFVSPIGNIAFGYRAGYNVSARGCGTFIGHQVAGDAAEPGVANTCVGFQAGRALNCNTGSGSADYNCVIGYQAGLRMTAASQNTLLGNQAGNNLTTGTAHVVIGENAGQALDTTTNNVMVGGITGVNLNGNNNTAVGYNAGSTAAAQTYTNTGSFGANSVPTGANQITLGDTNITTLRCQVTTITALSDQRDKSEIAPLSIGLDFINQVKVRQFKWNKRDGSNPHGDLEAGVVAQELADLQRDAGVEWLRLVLDADPQRLEATPGKLIFPLIKAVQELSAQVDALKAELAAK